jgi:hypothetical protein
MPPQHEPAAHAVADAPSNDARAVNRTILDFM